jgi:hypothetical protein
MSIAEEAGEEFHRHLHHNNNKPLQAQVVKALAVLAVIVTQAAN